MARSCCSSWSRCSNTGIEAACDAFSREFNTDIQLAKDCGSLAVLISILFVMGIVWLLVIIESDPRRPSNLAWGTLPIMSVTKGYRLMYDLLPNDLWTCFAGLPADLRFLVEKYPREDWQAHANIHGMANMWLERHDMFRELGRVLTTAIGDYREGRRTAPEFAKFFAPRLNFLLGHLDGHHNVEDQHYFPVFAAAE